jgi:hypothetical protein
MAVQLFLCSGKSGQLGIERFGMGLLERFTNCDLLGDQLNRLGTDVLDGFPELLHVTLDGPVVLRQRLKAAGRFLASGLDGLVQSCLLAGDRLHCFSQAVNAAAKLFLCSGKSRQLSVECFDVGLEGLATRNPLGDRFNCFGTDLPDILAEVVQLNMGGLVAR